MFLFSETNRSIRGLFSYILFGQFSFSIFVSICVVYHGRDIVRKSSNKLLYQYTTGSIVGLLHPLMTAQQLQKTPGFTGFLTALSLPNVDDKETIASGKQRINR